MTCACIQSTVPKGQLPCLVMLPCQLNCICMQPVSHLLQKTVLRVFFSAKPTSGGKQELKALHLYCGAGGMSFVGGRHEPGQFSNQQPRPDPTQPAPKSGPCPVHISTCWAVDHAEAMCRSFEVNHPETEVPLLLAMLIKPVHPNTLTLLIHWCDEVPHEQALQPINDTFVCSASFIGLSAKSVARLHV